MRSAVVRLMLASVLFAGWIGYLTYLAFTASHPIVLSRPQFLVSDIDVIARVEDAKSGKAVIEEVIAVRSPGAKPALGSTIVVGNLDQCKRLPHTGESPESVPLDWTGPGLYILPLHKLSQVGEYRVARIPPLPGYSARDLSPRIYPLTAATRKQLAGIEPPEKSAP